MNPLNLATTSSPPPVANDLLAKRKRGRPRKDETLAQQENSHVTPKPDINLVGKMVSGVVEGSFDAGYLLNVKVKDTDTKLRGLVFIPGKVTPVTPENDVAPCVKMFGREEINNQTNDQSLPKDQPMKDAVITDLEISESARDLTLMPQKSNGEKPKEAMMEKDGVIEEELKNQTNDQSLPKDQPMKDAVITDLENSESARALSLMPQESNGEKPKEAMMEKDGVTEKGEAATRLVEFFPTPETTMTTGQQNLVLVQRETTEQQKSPGESRGFDLMAEEPVCPGEKVPEELQLELGNKTVMSGDNDGNTTKTDPKTSASKSGFIANLFEGEDKKVDCDMEDEEATPSVQ